MKQINETIKFLEEKISEITGGLPVAVVESTENGAIVSFEGYNVYAITDKKLEGGNVVSVVGTLQVPAKAEQTKMGLLPFNHNAVEVKEVLGAKEAEFVKTLLIAKNFIKTI